MDKVFMTPKKDSLDKKQKSLSIEEREHYTYITYHNRKTFLIKGNIKWGDRHLNGNCMQMVGLRLNLSS